MGVRWRLLWQGKVSSGDESAPCPARKQGDPEILITARQAYPRLEALFLDARDDIIMGFRLFDPCTRLRSDAALAVGQTWADLMLHTLNRGVPIDLTVSDFDPVMAHDLHEQAWRFVSIITALNEISDPGAARVTIRCALHPAEGGVVPQAMFAMNTRKKLRSIAQNLNGGPEPAGGLRFAPGLRDQLALSSGELHLRRWALPRLFPVTLHHKMAVFDGAITYIGGLDVNERRFDDSTHDQPAQETWHDVQIISHDPDVARTARRFLRDLPDVIDRKAQLSEGAPGFLTTLSRRRRQNTFHLAPETVSRSILQTHLDQIASAQRLIYLETQFFRDRRIVSALIKAGRRNPGLRLLLLLPAAPEDAAFKDHLGLDARFGEYLQSRALRRVRRAFGDRFLAVSPVQRRQPDGRDANSDRATLKRAPIVYVHSKVSIFDDCAAIVSSANLNGRSMKWDAETGLLLRETAQVQALRNRLQKYWLPEDEHSTLETFFDVWSARACKNADLPPDQRSGFIVPHDPKPAARVGTPIPGAPEEMV